MAADRLAKMPHHIAHPGHEPARPVWFRGFATGSFTDPRGAGLSPALAWRLPICTCATPGWML